MISPGFFGFYTAQRSLLATQTALNTVNHNIANANTEGYSRQRVELEAYNPYAAPSITGPPPQFGQLGQGSIVSEITRLRDTLLDSQYRLVNSQAGLTSSLAENMKVLEGIMTEPSDNGISAALQKFFDAANDLSLHPETLSVRSNFLQQGVDLVNVFQERGRQLQDVQNSLVANTPTSQLNVSVTKVNDILNEVVSLNQQIATITGTGAQPNDLYDRRDKLLDELSNLANITVTSGTNGQIDVAIAGITMIRRTSLLDTLQVVNNPGPAPDPNYVPSLVRTVTGLNVLNDGAGNELTSGKIKGILDSAGTTSSQTSVYGTLAQLNNLIQSVTQEVNTLQLAGRTLTGALAVQPIFLPNPPAAAPPLAIFQYSVNSAVLSNPALVAAAINDATATSPAGFAGVGDGRNALAMAQLKNTTVATPAVSPLNATFDQYYNTLISKLGVDSASFQNREENQSNLINQLDARKSSVSGVNVDEETIDMLKYQRAFEASSRLVRVFDEVLQNILQLV